VNRLASQWIQLTLIAVVVYLVVRNYKGAAAVLNAGGTAYARSVNALQGQKAF
jgi:hypothetical protein